MGDRLTVGQRTLTPPVLVRIQLPQPDFSMRQQHHLSAKPAPGLTWVSPDPNSQRDAGCEWPGRRGLQGGRDMARHRRDLAGTRAPPARSQKAPKDLIIKENRRRRRRQLDFRGRNQVPAAPDARQPRPPARVSRPKSNARPCLGIARTCCCRTIRTTATPSASAGCSTTPAFAGTGAIAHDVAQRIGLPAAAAQDRLPPPRARSRLPPLASTRSCAARCRAGYPGTTPPRPPRAPG